MMQIVEQTYEDKFKMYSKLSKKELIKMLIESNRILDNLSKDQKPYFIQQPINQGGECFGGGKCSNPFHDCVNCPSKLSGGTYTTTSSFTYSNGSEIDNK